MTAEELDDLPGMSIVEKSGHFLVKLDPEGPWLDTDTFNEWRSEKLAGARLISLPLTHRYVA